jgi:hypothetical protein
MLANSGVLLSRRQFLISMFVPSIAYGDSRTRTLAIANPVKVSALLPGATKPEFWFGESVKFHWIDENSGQQHTEQGEVVGINWNSPEARWEYQVTWLSSTAYPVANYPIVDGNLVTADVLSGTRQ